MLDEKTEKIRLAILNDDIASFDTLSAGARYKELRFGRFPLLSLCYLYKAENIIKKHEKELLSVQTYFAVEEKLDDYYAFKKFAGKSLRLYLAGAIISPLEMLAVLKESRKLSEVYNDAYKNQDITTRLKQIYSLNHKQNVRATVDKIRVPVGSPTKREKICFALVALVCVLAIVFSSVLPNIFHSRFGDGSSGNPYSVKGQKQFSEYLSLKSGNLNILSDFNLNSDVKGRITDGNIIGNGSVITISEGFSGSLSTEYSGSISDLTFYIDMQLYSPLITSFSGSLKNVTIVYGEKGSGRFAESFSGTAENLTISYLGTSSTACFDTVSGAIDGLTVEYLGGSGSFCNELSGNITDLVLTNNTSSNGYPFADTLSSGSSIDGGTVTFEKSFDVPFISKLYGTLENFDISVNDSVTFANMFRGTLSDSSVEINVDNEKSFFATTDFNSAETPSVIENVGMVFNEFASTPFVNICACNITNSEITYKNGLSSPFVSVLYGTVSNTVFSVDEFNLCTDKDFSVVSDEVGAYQYGLGYVYGGIDDVEVTLSANITMDIGQTDESGIQNYASVLAAVNNGNISDCIANVNMSATNVSGKDYIVSGLVGRNNRTVSNCTVSEGSEIMGTTTDVSGIAGINSGTLSDCVNNAKLSQVSSSNSWNPNVAGICNMNGGTISTCTNNGDLTVAGECAEESILLEHEIGGIVNKNYYRVISCTNTGNISLSSIGGYVICAGIASANYNLINLCTATGDISVDTGASISYIGGIIAFSTKNESVYNYPQAGNSFFSGNISLNSTNEENSSFIGGICGLNFYLLVNSYSACHFDIDNAGQTYLGGITGIDGVYAITEDTTQYTTEYMNYYVQTEGVTVGVASKSEPDGQTIGQGGDINCRPCQNEEELTGKDSFPFKENQE